MDASWPLMPPTPSQFLGDVFDALRAVGAHTRAILVGPAALAALLHHTADVPDEVDVWVDDGWQAEPQLRTLQAKHPHHSHTQTTRIKMHGGGHPLDWKAVVDGQDVECFRVAVVHEDFALLGGDDGGDVKMFKPNKPAHLQPHEGSGTVRNELDNPSKDRWVIPAPGGSPMASSGTFPLSSSPSTHPPKRYAGDAWAVTSLCLGRRHNLRVVARYSTLRAVWSGRTRVRRGLAPGSWGHTTQGFEARCQAAQNLKFRVVEEEEIG